MNSAAESSAGAAARPKQVLPPSPLLRRAASRLRSGVGVALRMRTTEALAQGYFEAPQQAWAMNNLVARNVESCVALAEADACFLPGAFVLARSALETSAKILWMLAGDDPWERELRWILLVEEGLRFEERFTEDPSRIRAFTEFIEGVKSRLPEGRSPLHGMPSISQMLALAAPGKGLDIYHLLSQFTHGTHYAASLYRSGLGVHSVFRERIEEAMWIVPFNAAWFAMRESTTRLMDVTGVPLQEAFILTELQISKAIDKLASSTVSTVLAD